MNLTHLRAGARRTDGPVGRLVLLLIDVAEKAQVACGDSLSAAFAGQDLAFADLTGALQRLDKEANRP